MTVDNDLLVTWATVEHATCTRHKNYALSCEQFDALLERSDGRCELCGLPGQDSAWGALHIDHEHQVGQWAVRGLLCDGCNARLQRGRRLPVTPPLQRYLANSWYRLELDRLGLTSEIPAEPGLGSFAMTGVRRRWMRLSVSNERCWASMWGKVHCTFKTWPELWYEYGPFSLRITEERDSIGEHTRPLYDHAFGVLHLLECRSGTAA